MYGGVQLRAAAVHCTVVKIGWLVPTGQHRTMYGGVQGRDDDSWQIAIGIINLALNFRFI